MLGKIKTKKNYLAMSNTIKITLVVLFLIIIMLSSLFYKQGLGIEIAEKIHYMDSLEIDRKDKRIKTQDSIIDALYDIKITKITIIEKDTVSHE